jgi:hypothetical protein
MPPYPLFTFVGFFVHAVVFYAIGFHFLGKRMAKIFLFTGIGSVLYGINFTVILVLFFLFPNTVTKSYFFTVNAGIIVPAAVLFFLSGLVYYSGRTRRLLTPFLIVGFLLIGYFFWGTLRELRDMGIEPSYVHPAYPHLIAQSQFSGIISSFFFAIFFYYNAYLSTLFVKRRALLLGTGALFEGISTVYWVTTAPNVYLFTHIVGPIGSLLIALAVFWYEIPEVEDEKIIVPPQLIR